MHRKNCLLCFMLLLCSLTGAQNAEKTFKKRLQVLSTVFIDSIPVTPSCHASNIIEIPGGFMATWFGGEHESHPLVGIYIAKFLNGKWSTPKEVANGKQFNGKQFPTYNPVLQRYPDGEIVLFYKVGPGPSAWWGMLTRTTDNGNTWSAPEKLPNQIFGPIKNKAYLTASGVLICPSSSEDSGWRTHVEFTADKGKTWKRTLALNNSKDMGIIQPALLIHSDKHMQMLMRSQQDTIMSVQSYDGGQHWDKPVRSTLPNPNSGIDAVTHSSGLHILVYNPTRKDGLDRGELAVAISKDGKRWDHQLTLEREKGSEFSYPAIIEDKKHNLQITYTWNRKRIKHVVIQLN